MGNTNTKKATTEQNTYVSPASGTLKLSESNNPTAEPLPAKGGSQEDAKVQSERSVSNAHMNVSDSAVKKPEKEEKASEEHRAMEWDEAASWYFLYSLY